MSYHNNTVSWVLKRPTSTINVLDVLRAMDGITAAHSAETRYCLILKYDVGALRENETYIFRSYRNIISSITLVPSK